jgi:dipeptidyl aminopeptidase/acylaminoacyl peptidase
VEAAGFSARGAFAYTAYDEGQFGVIVGGEPMGPFGDVAELTWSPDGGRLAFIAGEPAKFERFVMVDAKRGPTFVDVRGLRFSPDSSRLAYVATDREGDRIVVDGNPGALYVRCQLVAFSGDSRTVIGRVGIDQGWAVVVNDRPGPVYDEVGPPVFSRDARMVAYGARRGERACVVVAGAESEGCDYVYRVAVGEKAGVAYALLQGKACVLFHNGREVYRGGPRPNHLAISPDGSSIAYSEGQEGKVRIVADGEAGESYTSVDRLTFAPDGKTPVYVAQQGEETYVVVGQKRHGPFGLLTGPVFNDAGDKIAVVARLGREIWRKILPLR